MSKQDVNIFKVNSFDVLRESGVTVLMDPNGGNFGPFCWGCGDSKYFSASI